MHRPLAAHQCPLPAVQDAGAHATEQHPYGTYGACTALCIVRARLTVTEYMHRTLAAAAHAIRLAEWRWGRTYASLGGSMRNGSRRRAVARVALGPE